MEDKLFCAQRANYQNREVNEGQKDSMTLGKYLVLSTKNTMWNLFQVKNRISLI